MQMFTDTLEYVAISKKEYEQLLRDSNFLSRLGAAGVDNWDGYAHAFEDDEDDQ